MTFFGNSIWQLVYQSDKITWFVLLTLLTLSIICWTLFFYKLITWRSKKAQFENVISNMKHVHNFENLYFLTSRFTNSVPGFFLTKNLNFLKNLKETQNNKTQFSDREWDFLQYNLDSSVDSIMNQEEKELPVFSVVAAISPLLGLFGTVWGLVHAFIDISKKQSADITTVAPGLAEALITTLAGLLVAIPALSMYYYLKMKSGNIEQLLLTLSDKFLAVTHKIFFQSSMEIDKCAYVEEKVEPSLQK